MALAWPIIRDLLALRDRLDSLFDEAMLGGEVGVADHSAGPYCPAADLYETDDEVVVVVEIPGVAAESVDVQLQENRLRVSGRIAAPERGPGIRLLRMERPRGSFFRDFPLPFREFVGVPKAELERGILTVRLAKASAARRQRVEIVEEE